MKLKYITCSDPREHNSIKSIMELSRLPHVEIAVQCHPSKMSNGMPRNVWFNELLNAAYQTQNINLAIHVNAEWANDICARGIIPDTIIEWIRLKNEDKESIIKRIQLNMPQKTAGNIKPGVVAQIIQSFPNQEFIFQYNNNTKDAIKKLHKTGAKFSLLFDASGGNGVAAENWQKPIYETHPMGYSGGMSATNVIGNLNKIKTLVDNNYETWIDAEGRIKSATLFDEKPKFDVDMACAYINRANLWNKMQQK